MQKFGSDNGIVETTKLAKDEHEAERLRLGAQVVVLKAVMLANISFVGWVFVGAITSVLTCQEGAGDSEPPRLDSELGNETTIQETAEAPASSSSSTKCPESLTAAIFGSSHSSAGESTWIFGLYLFIIIVGALWLFCFLKLFLREYKNGVVKRVQALMLHSVRVRELTTVPGKDGFPFFDNKIPLSKQDINGDLVDVLRKRRGYNNSVNKISSREDPKNGHSFPPEQGRKVGLPEEVDNYNKLRRVVPKLPHNGENNLVLPRDLAPGEELHLDENFLTSLLDYVGPVGAVLKLVKNAA